MMQPAIINDICSAQSNKQAVRRGNYSLDLERDIAIIYVSDSMSAPRGRRHYVTLIYVWFTISRFFISAEFSDIPTAVAGICATENLKLMVCFSFFIR